MEKLYNEGYLSYPRTETTIYHPTMNLKQIVANLSFVKELKNHCENLLSKRLWAGPRSGTKDDKAHPPIHPVRALPPDTLTNYKQVYDLLATHFLASLTKDAVGRETKVEA